MKKVAIFDCCGTITKTNNTFHFINFVTKDSLIKRVLFRFIVALNVLNLSRLSRTDFTRTLAIGLLRGYSTGEIHQKTEKYVELIKQKKLFNSQVISLIQKEKNEKDAVLLISASINPPIEELARTLDIGEYFASQLEIKNNKYTGKLKYDLLNNKGAVTKDLKNLDFKNSSFYSDNFEDLEVMQKFGSSYPVVPSPQAEAKWKRRLKNKKATRMIYVDNRKNKVAIERTGYVTRNNKNLIYIPTLYFFISRYRSIGILLEKFLPTWGILYFLSPLNLFDSFVITLISHFLFFAIYEIGALDNDLHAFKENKETATLRLPQNIGINMPLFVFLRIGIIAPILFYLFKQGYPVEFYASVMALCMALFFIHSRISNKRRVLTFTGLRVFYVIIPLLLLADYLKVWPAFSVLFINEAPKKIYQYVLKLRQREDFYNSVKNRFFYYAAMIVIGFLIYFFSEDAVFFVLPIYFLFLAIFGFYFTETFTKYEI